MSLSTSQLDSIENVERAVLSLVVQALHDYKGQIATVFREETDKPQDIAEDLTREAIATMGVSATHDRLYGKVDVKKAIYAFLPDPVPVALMLEAKAEKGSGSTARLQMSQTSMRVRFVRQGESIDEKGHLPTTLDRAERNYRVVTIVAKFVYRERKGVRDLVRVRIACIPSGDLQDRYNPSCTDTIWLKGPDAPSRGEDFRVRLSYDKLRRKAAWRVQGVNDFM